MLAKLLAVVVAVLGSVAAQSQDLNVRDFGAKGDGVTDDSAAFQRALDVAKEGRGLTVYAPPANYLFLGKLSIPQAVTLRGSWNSVPSHAGLKEKGFPVPTEQGTTFLVEGGRGTEDGAFITINTNATLKGVVMYWPKQLRNAIPSPYPWAIAMRGNNPTVSDVEILNPYDGIDAVAGHRHLIRNVQGQPLRRGLLVDQIFDTGRIENVHFNPWWSVEPILFKWQQEHGEAYIFLRCDWEYVLNTGCFGYNVGYRFLAAKNGLCNGNFVGLGADDCYTAVQVDASAPYGLLITNGEFTAFDGPNPVTVRVLVTNAGSVRFTNCAFWGAAEQVADIDGNGTVGFSDCTFLEWDRSKTHKPAILAAGGNLIVRGCEFQDDKLHIVLRPGVKKVVIQGNVTPKEMHIKNLAKVHIEH